MASEVVAELKRRREESPIPEGLPEVDLSIDELPEFRSIMGYDEDSELIAVISHPGWKSHHRSSDGKYRDLKNHLLKDGRDDLPDTNGVFRSRVLAVHDTVLPEAHFFVRQKFLEEQLFAYLAFHNIPTIVTIPSISYIADSEEDIKREIDRQIRDSVDHVETFNFILSQERFRLSKTLSEDFPDYLRDVRRGRDNFYLVPTDRDPGDEEKGLAHGTLLGDYEYRGLEREVVTRFLEAVDGKRVLFAGSNMPGCVNCTLGYFRYVDSEVLVLLNYCGVSKETEIDGFEEHELNGQGFVDYVRTHPQERLIVRKMFELYEGALLNIEQRTSVNPFFQTSPNARISSYDGYVTDLDLESF